MKYLIKTRKAGDYDAPWFQAFYERVKWGWDIVFPDGSKRTENDPTKYHTLRKTVTKNYRKWKERRKLLNEALHEKRITLWTEFWWAKFWRKGQALRKLASELYYVEDLPTYILTNKERSMNVLDALNQAEKHYRQYDPLFITTDPMLGYRIDSFREFAKDRKDSKEFREMPRRYIAYFKP